MAFISVPATVAMEVESLPSAARRKRDLADLDQGCQMAYFETKNPNLGHFLYGFALEDVRIFYDIWSILRLVGRYM
jgi:hypothetical protein